MSSSISTLVAAGHDPHTLPACFIAGRRGTARIDLARAEIRHVAFSPVEAFRSIQLQISCCRTQSSLFTNHVIHDVFLDGQRSLKITFVMAREQPWLALILEPDSSQHSDLRLRIDPNLDYIHKFMGQGSHQLQNSKHQVLITQTDHPELMAFVKSDLILYTSSTLTQKQKTVNLRIDRSGVLFLGGGYQDQIQAFLPDLDYALAKQELDQVIQGEQNWITQGAQLECPDPEITRFFQISRSWFHKAVRRLPFGNPFQTVLHQNQEIDLLSASPDYHGVFANDCIQSSVEGMIVAPDLKECYRHGLEALYHHASNLGAQIPESIELIYGNAQIYYAPLRIGQHPEWIISLASCVLLSGDRELGKQLWPGVQLALTYFIDPREEGLNIWDTSAYPEQPDTSGYRFGRVYAQAWWIWAFELAAELAGFLGYSADSNQLKQSAGQARSALETYFGREDGYGSWLSETGELHPHQDHEVIIPVALGLAPEERAQRVIETILSPEMWMDPYGPRRSNVGSGIGGGEWVWGFMRWNFIQALFHYKRTDQAVELASRWGRAELKDGLRASEVFSHRTATGITGEGYVWTAARATRALSYGLFGIRLRQEGLELDPTLPNLWPEMSLLNLPFRNRLLDIRVQRGEGSSKLNGKPWQGQLLKETDLKPGRNDLLIITY